MTYIQRLVVKERIYAIRRRASFKAFIFCYAAYAHFHDDDIASFLYAELTDIGALAACQPRCHLR